MKSVVLVLCLALAVLAQEKYENNNDDFDISEVLNNERLLNSYAKCLLNKGPCTPEIKSVKGKLKSILQIFFKKEERKQCNHTTKLYAYLLVYLKPFERFRSTSIPVSGNSSRLAKQFQTSRQIISPLKQLQIFF